VSDGQLVVGDDGPGIPTAEHDQVWAPFRRGDRSVGHGLGLAIVARITELHGGSVTLSEPPGLVVTVRFGHAATGA
jgi:signal transduction histidine kinase